MRYAIAALILLTGCRTQAPKPISQPVEQWCSDLDNHNCSLRTLHNTGALEPYPFGTLLKVVGPDGSNCYLNKERAWVEVNCALVKGIYGKTDND